MFLTVVQLSEIKRLVGKSNPKMPVHSNLRVTTTELRMLGESKVWSVIYTLTKATNFCPICLCVGNQYQVKECKECKYCVSGTANNVQDEEFGCD